MKKNRKQAMCIAVDNDKMDKRCGVVYDVLYVCRV